MPEHDAVSDYTVESDTHLSDLLSLDRWFVWAMTANGRKIPRAPWDDHSYADKFQSFKDSSIWTNFGEADEWARKTAKYGRASCIPPIEDNSTERLIFFDFDDCRDPASGDIHGRVWAFIEKYSLAGFISTSGTGVHGFGYGTVPEGYKPSFEADLDEWEHGDEAELELYASSRFMALTGEHIEETPTSAADLGDAAHELFEKHGTERTADDEENEIEVEAPDCDVTSDVADIYAAISNVRPRDIRLRST
jgi:hypothetical protein